MTVASVTVGRMKRCERQDKAPMYQTIPLQTNVIHPDEYRLINCITIDAEFQNLIPAISDDERKQLEANILADGGVRDPLTLWLRSDDDLVILDGHNRFEICQRLKLPFPCHEVEFDTRDEAADWIDKNQLGRRNLDARQMSLLRGRRYNRTKKPGRPSEQPGQNVRVSAESLAAEHGVNEKTIRRDGEFAEAVEALGIEREIVAGEIAAPKHEIVAAAKTLPDKPTPELVAEARDRVRRSPPRTGKGKSAASKPTAGETKSKNARLANRATVGLVTVREAVEELAQTDSTFRDSTLIELKRMVDLLSRPRLASDAKPADRPPSGGLRDAVAKRWESMRAWDRHWGVADMKEVRRLFAEIIRDEQKQFDK
jgi:hypothetical protein